MGKYLPLDGGEAALEVPAPRWVAEVALENASFILSMFLTDVFSSDLLDLEHYNWANPFINDLVNSVSKTWSGSVLPDVSLDLDVLIFPSDVN